MALPPEFRTEKVMAVNDALTKMSPQELTALPSLDQEDMLHFGVFVQTYCFIDLNLRRAIELFHLAKMIPKDHIMSYPNYQDGQLSEVLLETLREADEPEEEFAEEVEALQTIGRGRLHRNLISHFAAKRFPNADVYVFASKSNKDAKRVLREFLPKHGVHFAVGGRSDLLEFIKKTGQLDLWLAKRIPVWDQRYVKPENLAVAFQ